MRTHDQRLASCKRRAHAWHAIGGWLQRLGQRCVERALDLEFPARRCRICKLVGCPERFRGIAAHVRWPRPEPPKAAR